MDHNRIDKLTTAWGALGTLGMLAASAALAAPAQRGAEPAQPPQASRPPALPATGDAQLAQFVAEARALWPGLSPEVRAMVLELVRSRAALADRVSLAEPHQTQATQAIVTE
ncbi:hypothetical protein ACWA7J_18195 [Leptothrix sp. BB-4]